MIEVVFECLPSVTKMVSKVVELLLNSAGIMNFYYDRKVKVVKASKMSLVFSEIVFILLLINVLVIYKDVYSHPRSDFVYMLILTDNTNWIILLLMFNFDRLFRGHLYIRVLNRLIRLENNCALLSGELKTVWRRRYSRILYGTAVYILLYIPIKRHSLFRQSFISALLHVSYAFTYLCCFIFNGVFEMAFFQKIQLDLKCIRNDLLAKRRVTLEDFIFTFDMQSKLLDMTNDVGRLFTWTKLPMIVFLYIALPVYVFFIYFGLTDASFFFDLPGYVFWMIELIFLIFTCCVWGYPYSEVSF